MEKNTQGYRGISRDTTRDSEISSRGYDEWERGIDYRIKLNTAIKLLEGCVRWLEGKLGSVEQNFSILINRDYSSIPLKVYIELWPYPRDAQLSFKIDVSEVNQQFNKQSPKRKR